MSEFQSEYNPDLQHIYTPLEGYTAEETQRMYPFGYFVLSDGEIIGRDPLQEANAGLDVPEDEIRSALNMIAQDELHDLDYFFSADFPE